MKKLIKKYVEIEQDVCNICGKEIVRGGYDAWLERVKVVRGLLKTENFDAHPVCINKIIRNAFKEFGAPLAS